MYIFDIKSIKLTFSLQKFNMITSFTQKKKDFLVSFEKDFIILLVL